MAGSDANVSQAPPGTDSSLGLDEPHPPRAACDPSAGDEPKEPHATADGGSPQATEPSKRATPIYDRMRARRARTAPDLFQVDVVLRNNATGSRRVARPVSAIRELANARAQFKEERARLEEDQAQLEAQRAEFNQILESLGPALTAAATQQAEVERLSNEGGVQTRSNATRSKLDGGFGPGRAADAGNLTSISREMQQQGVGQVEVEHEAPPPRQPTLLEQMQALGPAHSIEHTCLPTGSPFDDRLQLCRALCTDLIFCAPFAIAGEEAERRAQVRERTDHSSGLRGRGARRGGQE